MNQNKQADCYNLCKTIVNGGGLPCLGNCPGGNVDRSQIYSICQSNTQSTFVVFTLTLTETFTECSPTLNTSCEWDGHCAGSICTNHDDCSDILTCNSGICN